MRRKRLLALGPLVFAAVMLAPSRARAQANYREMPIGGRTATMGGAGTAAGNDSAMPYLNPAGLAGVPADIFAVSATVYSYTSRSFDGFFAPNGYPSALGYQGTQSTFASNSIGELPSSVMYFKRLGDPDAHVHHHVGFSLVIPSARSVDVVGSSSGNLNNVAGQDLETASVTQRSTRYYVGPTYALGFGDDLRLGVSAYAIYQRDDISTSTTSNVSILGGSSGTSLVGSNSQTSQSVAFAPVLGVQWRAVADLWLGAGVALPSLSLSGSQQFVSTAQGTTVDPTSGLPQAASTNSSANLSYQANQPMRLNVGAAWDHRKGLSFAVDGHYYLPVTDVHFSGVQTFQAQQSGDVTRRYGTAISYSSQSSGVFDVSAGAEYALSDFIALRAGLFTDMASSPQIGNASTDHDAIRLDRYGATLGVGLTFGSFDTTIGGVFVYGTGRYGAYDSWSTQGVVPSNTTETTAMLVLSGAVTTAEAQAVISRTLKISPEVLPTLPEAPAGPAEPGMPATPSPPTPPAGTKPGGTP